MKHIRNVSWEVGDIVPDFELGKTTCALYLRLAADMYTVQGNIPLLFRELYTIWHKAGLVYSLLSTLKRTPFC